MNKEIIKNLIIEIKSKNKNVDVEAIKKFVDYKERIMLSDKEVETILQEIKTEKEIK
jgi:hypothetical protein